MSVIRYPKGDGIDLSGWVLSPSGLWRRRDFGGRDQEPDFDASSPRTVVVTYGRIGENAARAAEKVFGPEGGGRCAVVLLSRIVPLPEDEEFKTLVREADRVLFVEEGIRSGGIGESLAAEPWLGGKPVDIRAVEIPFLPHGSVPALTRLAGLDPDALAAWMREG